MPTIRQVAVCGRDFPQVHVLGVVVKGMGCDINNINTHVPSWALAVQCCHFVSLGTWEETPLDRGPGSVQVARLLSILCCVVVCEHVWSRSAPIAAKARWKTGSSSLFSRSRQRPRFESRKRIGHIAGEAEMLADL